ncbi:SusC/RagA family TonB-linked outer membrane protein [Sphingobacterium tabacisoli]|uniref:SusC/RagA family TonB-linked outer membrane protein n=1 Tax=Sphingobacterium tabacisoli TaxID=2044855 RepID=A0ABW5L7B8_9SPHI|nr:SusC/RagA family TonB-linked outer membrane protein [Sphingobacterium tabacisoli]
MVVSTILYGQNRELRGTVRSDDGKLISGATIRLKGTNMSSATNEEGRFELTVPLNNAVLVVSAVGFTTAEEAVSDKSTVIIVLNRTEKVIDEVYIQTAYGVTRKTAFTGSATVIDSKALENVNTSNVAQGLQGLSAGVQVVNSSGRPGAAPNITIRGIGSLGAETSPLYIVDGVPSDVDLNSFSPSDIESVTVMKDAAATSLYGSRAANGVIMITTKRGSRGQTRVNARGGWTINDFAVKFPQKVNPTKQWELAWEGLYNDAVDFQNKSDQEAREYASNRVPSVFWNTTPLELPDGTTRNFRSGWNMDYPIGLDGKLKPEAKRLWDFDLFDEAFDYRLKQDYGVDLSGAMGDNNQIYTSFSYLNDKGIHQADNFKRFNGRIALTSKVNNWLTMDNSMMYMNTIDKNGGFDARVFRTMPSEYSAYLWDYAAGGYSTSSFTGKPHLDEGITNGRAWWPRWSTLGALTEAKNDQRDNLQTVSSVNIRFFEGLSLKTTYSFQLINNSYSMWKSPERENQLLPSEGYVQRNAYRTYSHTVNNVLTFDKVFSGGHHMNVLAGQEVYSYTTSGAGATRHGLAVPYFQEITLAANDPTATSNFSKYGLASFFGKAEYDYDDRYFVSGSVRADGSSRWSPDYRWGKFFSLGGAWLVSKESFMENTQDWLQNLKLKASYGEVGNDRINSYYGYQALYSPYGYAGTAGVVLSKLKNEKIKWEANVQSNFGVDFTLFNKLSGSVEYFSRKSKDLLLGRPLAPSLGMENIIENIGDIRNRGWEFDLNYQAVKNANFSWRVSLNATTYKNQITSLPSKEEQFNLGIGIFKWREGGSRYDLFAPSFAGVNPDNGHNQWWKYEFDGKGNIIGQEKTETYDEVNVDKQRIHQGSVLPKVFGALENQFRYKGLDLSFMLYYSFGGKMYDYNFSESNVLRENFAVYDNLDRRWQNPGDQTDVAKIYTYETFNAFSNARYSDQYVFKNDFVRLRNVMLGYTVPSSLSDRLHISSLRMFFRGDNLLTFGSAKKRGTDPENFGYDSNLGTLMGVVDASSGVPALRSYTIGLNVSF